MNETERAAVELAIRYERSQGRQVTYVGDAWPPGLYEEVREWAQGRHPGARSFTCDLVSRDPDGDIARLTEVKGKGTCRSSVPILDRQREAMLDLGSDWWLYVVLDCQTAPALVVVREPRRLPWKLITPARDLPEGKYRGVRDEGIWHTTPTDVLALGEQVDVPS
ncbi:MULTISPECIES: protein NO VEIN domain-containing protein [unclassified Streptomyces]|uniref:protein NO VEIN domain-containing protein n=1 Tax=unclassified Streptomyces TaxID=2593676 RepID=UPI003D8AD783